MATTDQTVSGVPGRYANALFGLASDEKTVDQVGADLASFQALKVPDQEAVIGRTKPDSIELEDKPGTAHISRVVIEEAGEELEIYRRSTPYGTVGEHGLYFIAFSAELTRFDKMLARIFGGADGVRDRLTDFTRPVSGSYYFAPSLESLAAATDHD